MNDKKFLIRQINKTEQGVLDLELRDSEGAPVFDFKPGQYVMISYKNAKGGMEDKHAFSLASSPTAKDSFRLGIKILGKFTQGLAKMKEGDEIFVSGPFGKFVFDGDKHRDSVMIAGGIGITPFLSAMQYATDNRLSNNLSLIYSNKTLAGTLYYDKIKELEKQNGNLQSLFCLTDEPVKTGMKGISYGRISAQTIDSFTGGVAGKTFFICGPAVFMQAVKENLLRLGAPEKAIEMEEFSMINDAGFWPIVRNLSYAIGLSGLLIIFPLSAIFRSSGMSIANKNGKAPFFSFSSYDPSKIYDLAIEQYELAHADGQSPATDAGIAGTAIPIGRLPMASDATSTEATNPVAEPADRNKKIAATYVPTSVKTVKSAATKPAVPASPAKTVSATPAKQAASAAPSPVTATSITTHEVPVGGATPQPTTPATQTASVPSPVTSASGIVTTPAPAPTTPAAQTPSASSPAPVTSASGTVTVPVPSAPAPSAPAPTTTGPAPAPATSASGTVITPAPTTPGTVASPAPTQPRRNNDDDEEDDD